MLKRIAAMAALLALTATAEADVILMLDDGMGNVVTIADGSANDSSAVQGVVNYSGSLGGFLVSVSTGISYPTLGTLIEPILHLNSVDVSAGVGMLTISLTSTDYVGPVGTGVFTMGFGGVTDGTIDVNGYLDMTNAEFGTSSLLASLHGTGGPFSGNASGVININTAPFSVTLVATINHQQGGVSSFDADLRVPEPGALALFGAGLLLLGFFRPRRRARARI
jgi:hypothetical protein